MPGMRVEAQRAGIIIAAFDILRFIAPSALALPASKGNKIRSRRNKHAKYCYTTYLHDKKAIIFPVAFFSFFFPGISSRLTFRHRELPSHRSVRSVRKTMQVFRQRECRLGARSNSFRSIPKCACGFHVESLRYREPWYQAVLRVS